MGVCSYCGEYAKEWEECFSWDQAIGCSEKARRNYEKRDDDAEKEKNAINDALGGFDNYALGYRVPN